MPDFNIEATTKMAVIAPSHDLNPSKGRFFGRDISCLREIQVGEIVLFDQIYT